MVIEHTFVTTLEQGEALQSAAAFLNGRGFAPDESAEKTGGSVLQMRRGGSNAAKARSIAELPQSVRVDFDRGRVALAASITPSAAWGGRSWANSEVETRMDDTRNPNRLKLHTDMLMGMVSGLEQLLVQRVAPELAYEQWDQAQLRVADAARRRRRKVLIALAALGLVIAGAIALIVHSVR